MDKKRIISILLLMGMISCVVLSVRMIPGESARAEGVVSLDLPVDWYNPASRLQTVNVTVPGDREIGLIASTYDRSGKMKESVFKTVTASGEVQIPFRNNAFIFNVMAVDTETLAPVADNIRREREITDLDFEVKKQTVYLSDPGADIAKVLSVFAADCLRAGKAMKEIRSLVTDRTVDRDGSTVTKFEALYGDEDVYDDVIDTLDAADAANQRMMETAALLNVVAGTVNGETGEKLKKLAKQAGKDSESSLEALTEARIEVNTAYLSENHSGNAMLATLNSALDNRGILFGGGSGSLMPYGVFVDGADLAAVVGESRSAFVIDPDNGKFDNAGADTFPEDIDGTLLFCTGCGSGDAHLGIPGAFPDIATGVFSGYHITAAAGGMNTEISEVSCSFEDAATNEQLTGYAETYFGVEDLGTEKTWKQTVVDFVATNVLTDAEKSMIAGEDPAEITEAYKSVISAEYNAARGYTEVTTGVDHNGRSYHYTLDQNGEYVGAYEEYRDGRKMIEKYYSTDRSAGCNGLLYEKTWMTREPWYLAHETTYSNGGANIPDETVFNEPCGTDAFSENGISEDIYGFHPKDINSCIRTEKSYYAEDENGDPCQPGMLQSLYVYQWRQDRYDAIIKDKGPECEFEAETNGWFQLLFRYFTANGKLQTEDMVIMSGTILRKREYCHTDYSISSEQWYEYMGDEYTGYFAMAKRVKELRWYDYPETGVLASWPEAFKTQMKGHISSMWDNGYYEVYEAGMWNLKTDDDGNKIPGTVDYFVEYDRTKPWYSGDRPEFYDPGDFDCIGWEKSYSGSDPNGSVEYICVISK
ncbi:MAG: hypothetical protein K6C95_05225 [Lachnospiraceae bacterium]|nr:hypothetical protein [Lachnospiraceae bacterium]